MSILTYITENKIMRALGYCFLFIILGAIGAGLWERYLSHLFYFLSNILLFSISNLFHGYVDILHQNIGMADIIFISVYPSNFFNYYYYFFTIVSCCHYVFMAKER